MGRLDTPEGARELAQALEILGDGLAPGARILDLGGGPGRYAIELAKRGHRSGLIGVIDRAANQPAQVSDAMLRTAAETGVFSNVASSGFQEGYNPVPGEIEQLFAEASFRIEDVLSLKSIADGRAHQLAQLEPTVRAEIERLARAMCRRPEIIATCGHSLIVARKAA